MLTLDAAREIVRAAREKGRQLSLKPLSVCVLDAGGHVIAFEREDGASALRFQMAHAKAYGCIALGIGSRAINARAEQQAYFVDAVNALANGALLPVPGGLLVKDANGHTLGAVGVTGDTSDNDEICAIAGVEAVGLTPETGA